MATLSPPHATPAREAVISPAVLTSPRRGLRRAGIVDVHDPGNPGRKFLAVPKG